MMRKTESEALRRMANAAEMLWAVLANVSGGNWQLQSKEWRRAAARWRNEYFRASNYRKNLEEETEYERERFGGRR